MAKMHRGKAVSQACRNRYGSRWITDYELGHRLWQSKRQLPLNASKLMQEGFANGALEQWQYNLALIRQAYREGRLSIIPRYESLVRGIEVGTTYRAEFALTRGGKRSKYTLGTTSQRVSAVSWDRATKGTMIRPKVIHKLSPNEADIRFLREEAILGQIGWI